MGLFGNVSEFASNLGGAIENLYYHPMNEDNILAGVLIGGALFMRQSISAFAGPVQNIFESFKSGFTYLI